jgi:hypothetical protein
MLQTTTPDCADVTVASVNLRQNCEATQTNATVLCPQPAQHPRWFMIGMLTCSPVVHLLFWAPSWISCQYSKWLREGRPERQETCMSAHESGTHPAFYQTVLWVKQRSCNFVTDVQLVANAWSYNSAPSYAFRALCWIRSGKILPFAVMIIHNVCDQSRLYHPSYMSSPSQEWLACDTRFHILNCATAPILFASEKSHTHAKARTKNKTLTYGSWIVFGKLTVAQLFNKKKLHGLSPRANYIDRETAACRRSDCQLLRIEGATWSAWWIPTAVFSVFLTGAATFLSSSFSVVLTRLSGPRSRPITFFLFW